MIVLDGDKSGGRIERITKTPLQYMLWHSRAAKLAGAAFVATSVVITPFLHGNVLHKYWEPWGKMLLLADMAIFLLLLFEGGISLIYWLYLHDK
jgi:hypothetical protein